jgi:hypothetical protein
MSKFVTHCNMPRALQYPVVPIQPLRHLQAAILVAYETKRSENINRCVF